MDFANKLISQIKALWSRWTVAQRATMVGALILSVASIVGVGVWATTPEYVTLADNLSPQQAAEVVSVLEAQNMKYQLNYAGSAVSVSRTEVGRARLALKDVVTLADAPADDIGDGIWTDPTLHHARLSRQLESRLSRSISQLSSVRSATVHLTQPDNSPFVRSRSPAKASVVIDLHPSAMFSAADARSIVALVAHSVEHLDPRNVSVLDTNGRLLSGTEGVEADVSGQLAYRTHVEADLSAKAESILTQMLGPGRAVVRVTADVDFTELQRKETRFDPDSKVKLSETIHTESTAGGNRAAVGRPGTAENLDPLAFNRGGSQGSNKVESIETQYENARTENTVREAPGRIRRLTVAAVVQLPAAPDPAAASSETPAVAAVTREQVERIVKQAVGFDATRNDQIEVIESVLTGNEGLQMLPVTGTGWDQYEPLIRNLSLGIAAIVALILGMMVIRRMKPIVVETESREALPTETVFRLAELSQQAKENPEAVASVVRSWLDQNEPIEQREKKAG